MTYFFKCDYIFTNLSALLNDAIASGTRPIWPKHNTSCSQLKGTDGTMFQPSLSKSQRLYAFEPILCRYSNIIRDLRNRFSTVLRRIPRI